MEGIFGLVTAFLSVSLLKRKKKFVTTFCQQIRFVFLVQCTVVQQTEKSNFRKLRSHWSDILGRSIVRQTLKIF